MSTDYRREATGPWSDGSGSVPFDIYPSGGRTPLGHLGGGNARRGYGLKLQQKTGQTACAYCGMSLVDSYEHWLMLSVDHVVPVHTGDALRIPDQWLHDYCNKVVCCLACNGFGNRYKLPRLTPTPRSFEEFCDLRDRVFLERRDAILQRHQEELSFYSAKPWKADGPNSAK